jgi:hypothetical protein
VNFFNLLPKKFDHLTPGEIAGTGLLGFLFTKKLGSATPIFSACQGRTSSSRSVPVGLRRNGQKLGRSQNRLVRSVPSKWWICGAKIKLIW